jgi:hypothetical protein
MGSSYANLTLRLLFAGAALAAACSAEAQHAGRRPGEAILFSSPDGDDVSSNMPSLAAKPPGMLDFENAVQSPATKFGGASDKGAPQPPPPAISPAQVQQMQRQFDERKNWALLTPEQILGLPTQEKILGIQDRDAFGRPKNESVVAQYYERQEMSRTRTNNDNYAATEPAPQWGILGGQSPQMGPNIWTPAGSRQGNSAFLNQFLNGTPDNRDAAAQTPQSGWSKSFNLPAPPPKATPEQEAAMAQFRQLLQPHSPPGGALKNPASGSSFFSPSTAPASGSSAVIPIGASFTRLNSGIATPVGLTPLPGLLGPTNAAASVFAPEWKPQQPPWMSSQPQLGVIPQRKF